MVVPVVRLLVVVVPLSLAALAVPVPRTLLALARRHGLLLAHVLPCVHLRLLLPARGRQAHPSLWVPSGGPLTAPSHSHSHSSRRQLREQSLRQHLRRHAGEVLAHARLIWHERTVERPDVQPEPPQQVPGQRHRQRRRQHRTQHFAVPLLILHILIC